MRFIDNVISKRRNVTTCFTHFLLNLRTTWYICFKNNKFWRRCLVWLLLFVQKDELQPTKDQVGISNQETTGHQNKLRFLKKLFLFILDKAELNRFMFFQNKSYKADFNRLIKHVCEFGICSIVDISPSVYK